MKIDLGISNITKDIFNKKIKCIELMRFYINNLKKHNPLFNAIVAFNENQCLEQARLADKNLSKGNYYGILHGIPIGIKDNYQTKDYPTTACSDVLKNKNTNLEDAPIIKKLKKEGAIIMAKTNMHEWAFGATNEISNIGATINPWNNQYISGGSSGGSAVGLATNMFPFALGSDTGGSIRIPAAACGVCGIKPTYGIVNKEKVYPLSFSLDVTGPMAKIAKDLELLLKVMIEDKYKNMNFYDKLKNIKGLRFGIPVGENFERNKDVEKAFQESIKTLEKAGAIIEEVKIPNMKQGLACWKAILYTEATAYHQKNLKYHSKSFGHNIKIMLESGQFVSGVQYIKAHQFRKIFNDNINKLFKNFDALLFTTLPVTAPKLGAGITQVLNKTISSQNSMIYLAWLANYTGYPQVAIPCGFGDNNLPISLAIMGKPLDDFKLLQIAKYYQTITNFHNLKPVI